MPAVIDSEWQYIRNFNSSLAQLKLEEYISCHEKWFDMKLLNGVCKVYCGSNLQKTLFSQINNINIRSIPDNLPSLREIEEILIAKAYIHVQIQQIKGQQFFYSGHAVNFMQNITKVYQKLPLLPSDLDIITLKPKSGFDNNNRTINQRLEQIFCVQQEKIRVWLNYLQKHYPDYKNITIDSNNLKALPENGSIHYSLITRNSISDAKTQIAEENHGSQNDL